MYHYHTLTMAPQKGRKDPIEKIPFPMPEPRPIPVSPRLFEA